MKEKDKKPARKKSEDEVQEEGGKELCPRCGNLMVEEDGENFCSSCSGEIDFLGEEDEDLEEVKK